MRHPTLDHTHRYTGYLLDLSRSWAYADTPRVPARNKNERAHYWHYQSPEITQGAGGGEGCGTPSKS